VFLISYLRFQSQSPYVRATVMMTSCGTPSYMPPEVFLDDVYTTKADVFSYAMIMYVMITGHAPWSLRSSKKSTATNKFAIVKRIGDGKRPKIPDLASILKVIDDGRKSSKDLLSRLLKLMTDCWKVSPILNYCAVFRERFRV